ncbi:MAG TPA: arginine decarboxylase, partial [Thermoanaerobaculia bacterium]|nr:arginine decarboxylase [Thermoanaerobaculia bacterium]
MTTQQELIEAQAQEDRDWTIEDASSLYMIDRWGAGYFDVAPTGEMTVAPLQQKGSTVPIIEVVREAQSMNLATPLLIRFQDLLRHRVEALNRA